MKNREKRLSYAKWHKKWTENQQQVWWRDESSPEPWPQHHWSSVGSSWQRMEQKAADIQGRALECPSRSLENYSWRLLKEITESLSKRVQAGLKNKCAQTKYWLRISQTQFLLFILYFHPCLQMFQWLDAPYFLFSWHYYMVSLQYLAYIFTACYAVTILIYQGASDLKKDEYIGIYDPFVWVYMPSF